MQITVGLVGCWMRHLLCPPHTSWPNLFSTSHNRHSRHSLLHACGITWEHLPLPQLHLASQGRRSEFAAWKSLDVWRSYLHLGPHLPVGGQESVGVQHLSFHRSRHCAEQKGSLHCSSEGSSEGLERLEPQVLTAVNSSYFGLPSPALQF